VYTSPIGLSLSQSSDIPTSPNRFRSSSTQPWYLLASLCRHEVDPTHTQCRKSELYEIKPVHLGASGRRNRSSGYRGDRSSVNSAIPFLASCLAEISFSYLFRSERLKGKRIAIKDNFMLRGTRTTCSSRMLQGKSRRWARSAPT
jgi:hypothetical protein